MLAWHEFQADQVTSLERRKEPKAINPPLTHSKILTAKEQSSPPCRESPDATKRNASSLNRIDKLISYNLSSSHHLVISTLLSRLLYVVATGVATSDGPSVPLIAGEIAPDPVDFLVLRVSGKG